MKISLEHATRLAQQVSESMYPNDALSVKLISSSEVGWFFAKPTRSGTFTIGTGPIFVSKHGRAGVTGSGCRPTEE